MNDQPLNILVLAGTSRAQRQSIKAARYIAARGSLIDNVTISFADPTDFDFPGDGNDPEGKDPRYTALVEQADALFVVTPEYNHSFPGSLKRMLDSEDKLYIHKPVAFAGVSNRNWGGLRAIEALVGTVREMGLIATFTDVYFPNVNVMFDEAGELLPEFVERYERNVGKAYAELIWMARALKYGRDNLS